MACAPVLCTEQRILYWSRPWRISSTTKSLSDLEGDQVISSISKLLYVHRLISFWQNCMLLSLCQLEKEKEQSSQQKESVQSYEVFFFLKESFTPRYSTVHSPTWETKTHWKDDRLQKPSFMKDANIEPRTLDALGHTPSSHTWGDVKERGIASGSSYSVLG